MRAVSGSKYRHYKGGEYLVLNIAVHTETGEEMVVYEDVKSGKVWARSRQMFEEKITTDTGDLVSRFMLLEM